MSTGFPLLLNSDHRILRNESCSGYMDVFGIWNTGFYCPQTDSKSTVYCCGTETFKYCCTTKFSISEEALQAPNSTVIIRTPIIIGVVIGFVTMILFLILTVCLVCPCCLLFKKRSTHLPPGLYRMHCGTSSTTSGLVSLNSPCNSIENTRIGNNNLWTTMQTNANYYRNVNSANDVSSHLFSPNQFSPRVIQENCQISTSGLHLASTSQSYSSSNRIWRNTNAESYCRDLLNSSSVCYSTNYQPTSSDIYSQNSNNSRIYSTPYCNLFYRLRQTTNPTLQLERELGESQSTPLPVAAANNYAPNASSNDNFDCASSSNSESNTFGDGQLRGSSPRTFTSNHYNTSLQGTQLVGGQLLRTDELMRSSLR